MTECKTCDEPLTPETIGQSGTRCLDCEAFLEALAEKMRAHPEHYGLPSGDVILPWQKPPDA